MAQSKKSKSSRGVVLAVVAVAVVVLAGLLLVQALGGDQEPEQRASSEPSARDVEAPPAGECV
jgi:flagellar basal body-associated protein FliL